MRSSQDHGGNESHLDEPSCGMARSVVCLLATIPPSLVQQSALVPPFSPHDASAPAVLDAHQPPAARPHVSRSPSTGKSASLLRKHLHAHPCDRKAPRQTGGTTPPDVGSGRYISSRGVPAMILLVGAIILCAIHVSLLSIPQWGMSFVSTVLREYYA